MAKIKLNTIRLATWGFSKFKEICQVQFPHFFYVQKKHQAFIPGGLYLFVFVEILITLISRGNPNQHYNR